MTQEALKLVMDALDNLLYWDNGKPEYDEARKALQVGKQALAQEQEPVAWIHIMDNTEGIRANGKGIISITQKRKHPFGKVGIDFDPSYPIKSTPLYAAPPQRTEQSGWRKAQIDDAEEEAWKEMEKKNGVD